ncbi:hypothetical protein J8273_1168 [Carpediemonas membranifera]|nr:hypothetical protein J8273_1168 [Carpediemonas membranifera]|eukprot:KAG9397253.1 hypothetical protein J8273_1168 [Carpediemonas membranifera]
MNIIANYVPTHWLSSAAKREGTTLSTIQVKSIDDCHELIGLKPSGFTPIVLIPKRRPLKNIYVRVPDGFTGLATRWGKRLPPFDPGRHMLLPGTRMVFMVTRRSNVFSAPIKNCKSKDNVDVQIEVLLVFKIISAEDFIYKLGPEKLDDLLRASQEDFVRQIVRNTLLIDVYSLQGRNTEGQLNEMNEKFRTYGVIVDQITITRVKLEDKLADTLQKRAEFDIRHDEEKQKQLFDMNVLNHKEDLSKQQNSSNERLKEMEKENDQMIAEIDREIAEIRADTKAKISVIEAETTARVNQVKADAEMEAAKADAERITRVRDIQAQAAFERDEILAQIEQTQRESKAEADRIIAEAEAAALTILAKAEAEAAKGLEKKRQADLAFADVDIISGLARNKEIAVSGADARHLAMAAAVGNGKMVYHN